MKVFNKYKHKIKFIIIIKGNQWKTKIIQANNQIISNKNKSAQMNLKCTKIFQFNLIHSSYKIKTMKTKSLWIILIKIFLMCKKTFFIKAKMKGLKKKNKSIGKGEEIKLAFGLLSKQLLIWYINSRRSSNHLIRTIFIWTSCILQYLLF